MPSIKTNIILLLLFTTMIFFSCKDDYFIEEDKITENIWNSEHRSIDIPNIPFFNPSFVADSLGITPRLNGILPSFEDLLDNFHYHYLNDPQVKKLETNNLHPAWNLAEPFFFVEGFTQYYVPVFNLSEETLHSILIMRYEESNPKYYVLWEEVIGSIESTRPSGFSQYWRGVFDYFNGELTGSRYEEVASGMQSVCYQSLTTLWCECTGPQQDPCGNFGAPPCDFGCGSIGGDPPGGGDGPPGGGSGNDQWEIHIFSNEIPNDFSGGNSGTGNNNSGNGPFNNSPYKHKLSPKDLPPFDGWLSHNNTSTWDNYIKGFDCNDEAGFLDMGEDDNYEGGSGFGELDFVPNQGSLFELQLGFIIADFNLAFTTDELREILITDCSLSLYSHVNAYARYRLVDFLSEKFYITDIEK